MSKIYISGGITGREIEVAEAHFYSGCEQVRAMGMTPVNPMTIEHNHDKTWENYMKTDIKAMMDCDSIFMLTGWKESKGAKIEYALAMDLGMKVYFERQITEEKAA